MKSPFRRIPLKILYPAVATVAAGLAIGAWVHFHGAHSANHDHGTHDDHHAAALSLDDGKRWETDQALRTGMERIRAAVDPVLAAHAGGQVSPGEAKAMAAAIQESVNYLIANCKLPPRADATLHVFITDFLTGASMVAENPASHEGISLVADALNRYPEYFDHPGWVSVGAPAP